MPPSLHASIPEALRKELMFRLVQGGMGELFRVGTIDAINRLWQAGVEAGYAERNPPKKPPPPLPEPVGELTARQTQVLILSSQGLCFKAAAKHMECGRATVVTHADNLRRRIGAKNMAHAVGIGYRTGLLSRSNT